MNSNEEIRKEMVKQKYAEIALQNQDTNASSCCGSGGLQYRSVQYYDG